MLAARERLQSAGSKYILGIRIRSEGLAQVMTKRNASEYIHHRKYTEIPTRDTVVAGLS